MVVKGSTAETGQGPVLTGQVNETNTLPIPATNHLLNSIPYICGGNVKYGIYLKIVINK